MGQGAVKSLRLRLTIFSSFYCGSGEPCKWVARTDDYLCRLRSTRRIGLQENLLAWMIDLEVCTADHVQEWEEFINSAGEHLVFDEF